MVGYASDVLSVKFDLVVVGGMYVHALPSPGLS
jgi:hypothetical protein